jgi:hypothetical protein
MFRGSERGLKGDPLFFGSPEGEIKSEEESYVNEAQTHIQERL